MYQITVPSRPRCHCRLALKVSPVRYVKEMRLEVRKLQDKMLRLSKVRNKSNKITDKWYNTKWRRGNKNDKRCQRQEQEECGQLAERADRPLSGDLFTTYLQQGQTPP